MPKPKAKTFQQKLGFFDDDLKSQTHDEILKWINDNASDFITEYYNLTKWNLKDTDKIRDYVKEVVEENKESLIKKISDWEKEILDHQQTITDNELYFKNAEKFEIEQNLEKGEHSLSFSDSIKEYKTKVDNLKIEIKSLESRLSALNDFDGLGELPQRKKAKIFNLVWEPPISTMNTNNNTGYKSSKFIIGFLDLMISFYYYKPTVIGIDLNKREVTGKIAWEQTFEKINLEDGYSDGQLYKTIFIEAKTKIDSLGELFRQLRTYKEYIREDIIVVCPNDDEKDLIINQGFGFHKYRGKH
jgi:hypothetical protein